MRRSFALVLLGSALLLQPSLFAQSGSDAQIRADVQHQLNKKQFKDVRPELSGNAVTLTGTVETLADKMDAEKRVQKIKDISSVTNQISVQTSDVSDQVLFNKLGKQLLYDRQGYPSYPFNGITLKVDRGVVTLGGLVVDPVDKTSAVSLVTNMPGVTGLIDNLKVAPVSPMDWRIRRQEYQAVYGSPVSTKYAIDPAKPIRILVENGHVILTGVVQNTGDKDIIFQRANGVPGVFSVTNDLQVAGQESESGH